MQKYQAGSWVSGQTVFYLVDTCPTKNPYGLYYVSKGGLCSQAYGALKILTQELGIIWDRAVLKEKKISIKPVTGFRIPRWP